MRSISAASAGNRATLNFFSFMGAVPVNNVGEKVGELLVDEPSGTVTYVLANFRDLSQELIRGYEPVTLELVIRLDELPA